MVEVSFSSSAGKLYLRCSTYCSSSRQEHSLAQSKHESRPPPASSPATDASAKSCAYNCQQNCGCSNYPDIAMVNPTLVTRKETPIIIFEKPTKSKCFGRIGHFAVGSI